jgi:putative ABC transport system substrate-binding protein
MTTILYLSLAIATVVAGPIAEAQQAKKIHKIGFLSASSQSSFVSASAQALVQELQTLGYIEGKNIFIEYRAAEGKYDQLPHLAAELIDLKVDLIIANSALAARPAKEATKTIPIVM